MRRKSSSIKGQVDGRASLKWRVLLPQAPPRQEVAAMMGNRSASSVISPSMISSVFMAGLHNEASTEAGRRRGPQHPDLSSHGVFPCEKMPQPGQRCRSISIDDAIYFCVAASMLRMRHLGPGCGIERLAASSTDRCRILSLYAASYR